MNKGVRELAKATGYSIATISRVMNGSQAVKKQTRDHILSIARELNFFPNPAAKALATRRSHLVGAVIPTIEHSIFAKFIRAIEETLAEKNYSLVIATTDFNVEKEKNRAFQLLNMGAEALVVSGLDHDEDILSMARARNVPVLCTSIYQQDATLPTIGYDNYGLGRQAAEYLTGLGHKHIAVLHGGLSDNDRTQLRIDGVKSILNNPVETVFLHTPLSVTGGASSARQVLKFNPRPTAILCLSDVIALGVLFEAQRQNVRVPNELSVMGFDNLEWASASYPPLTTIRLPVTQMGKITAQALVGFLDEGVALISQRLEGNLVIRDSTGRLIKK